MAKVTIAIPTYNRPDMLAETIASIFRQTFQDFTILVFDDVSDFSIGDFTAKFGHDPRLVFLRSTERLGGNAKNFERIMTYPFQTPYVMVFHDDDVMHETLVEQEVRALDQHPEARLVGTGLTFIHNPAAMNKFPSFSGISPKVVVDAAGLTRIILKGFHWCFGSVMYRKEALTSPVPFQEKFSKWWDRPYVVTALRSGKAVVLLDPLVNYRIHANQDSGNRGNEHNQLEYTEQLMHFYRDMLPQPLSNNDAQLFYSHTTNSTILFAGSISQGFRGFFHAIGELKKRGLWHARYINFKGLYYFAKILTRKLFHD